MNKSPLLFAENYSSDFKKNNKFDTSIVEALKIPQILANSHNNINNDVARKERGNSQENRLKYSATVDLNPKKSNFFDFILHLKNVFFKILKN